MPSVLRVGPYRFFFYSNESNEPPHIHVREDDREAPFWLTPVHLAFNHGFRARDLDSVETLVARYRNDLLEAWNESFT